MNHLFDASEWFPGASFCFHHPPPFDIAVMQKIKNIPHAHVNILFFAFSEGCKNFVSQLPLQETPNFAQQKQL